MARDFFRILSLSGGGVRGILQAEMLSHFERQLGTPLKSQFDLIAGTSVGGIIAAGLAHGVAAEQISTILRETMPSVFRARRFAIFSGPKYSSKPLNDRLAKEFGNARINGLDRRLILVSATLDRFQIKLITNVSELRCSEMDISLVDAALATAAAPTYFAAVQPEGKEQCYVDGGVWANSPSLISYFAATKVLKIPESRVKLLHFGTGTTPVGIGKEAYQRLRPIGFSTVKTILDLIGACQVDGIEYQLRNTLGVDNYLSINPQLLSNIDLDNIAKALRELPPLAESTFQQYSHELESFFPPRTKAYVSSGQLANYEMIAASGLRAFIPHRRYYADFREGAGSITTYIQRAKHNLTFVSITLLTGTHLENLKRGMEGKLRANPEFKVKISLLCPGNEGLMMSVAPILGKVGSQLQREITETLEMLKVWKSELGDLEKSRLMLQTHNALPLGSAIIIDEGYPDGIIQIETKAYKAPMEESFAFEIGDDCESGLYRSLMEGYGKLLNEGAETH